MDANRYFEEMHRAMAAQRTASQLVLTARYQDTAGSDAYLELRRSPADGSFRILYSTMGRSELNFQLFRKGWQLCHNAAGELTGRFPSSAEGLLDQTDFRAFYRDEPFDPDKASHILDTLRRHAGQNISAPAQRSGSCVTVDSYIGGGAHWSYAEAPGSACLPAAAILYWLSDQLAGRERRALQSDPQAARLAAQWEGEIAFAKAPVRPRPVSSRPAYSPAPYSRTPVRSKSWQSILAVMNTM